MTSHKHVHILVVEDSEPDAILLTRALTEMDIDVKIRVAKSGEEALDYVFKRNGFANCVDPDLIILDLNLPQIGGHQVLREIKSDDCLRTIPVIVYTSSDNPEDVWWSYNLYANSYVVKTFDLQEVFSKIKEIGRYWFKTATLARPI